MDMNQLFYHHQMALMQKATGRTDASRTANVDLSAHYGERIEAYRARRGMTTYFTNGAAAR